jgi:hypothetical protein
MFLYIKYLSYIYYNTIKWYSGKMSHDNMLRVKMLPSLHR